MIGIEGQRLGITGRENDEIIIYSDTGKRKTKQ